MTQPTNPLEEARPAPPTGTPAPGSGTELRERILHDISTEKITMKPKWHFMLKALLFAGGSFIATLILLYLVSFVVFILHQSGAWFAPSFGLTGWYALLLSLPWILILTILIFMGILELFVRRYAFAYRRPLAYSIAGIIMLGLGGGWLLSYSSLHRQMADFAERRLPVARAWYHTFERRQPPSVYRGIILRREPTGFALQNRSGEQFMVVITERTRLPYGAQFATGSKVVVFGDRERQILRAFGVRVIED